MKPLCFVLMPFGIKTDGNKNEIDFDKVYESFIKPAIIDAGLDPIRADEEKGGGFIHKPMYERLMFCDFAVADLSFANANVFYELGIRHALKPYTTVSIFEINTKLPFDTAPLRTFPYDFNDGAVVNVKDKIKELAVLVKINLNAKRAQADSPIAQLITNYKFPDLNSLQKDAEAFTDWVNKFQTSKSELDSLVKEWKKSDSIRKMEIVDKVKQIELAAGAGLGYNYELLHALLDTYKSMSAFKEISGMLKPVVNTTAKNNIFLRQQLALALNKINQRDDAEKILTSITDQYGPDPETNGLLGAVYKGLMDDNKSDELMMEEYRTKAIEAYLSGFESDPRDYYPGINALTLMYFNDTADERFNKFLPLVSYAVERQLPIKPKDYWVQATALELATLETNEVKSNKYLASSLACNPADWMKESTASNLKKIYDKAVVSSGEEKLKWLGGVIGRLN